MVDKKKQKKSFIQSTFITLVIIVMLIISGPLASALKVTLFADKTQVRAGAAGNAGNITFTTWVNLSSPDRYVPIQRIYLNLSGPLPRSFSFNPNGGDIQGTGFGGELTVTTAGFGSSNYGFGSGYGYGYNTGSYYDFGYGYGYGSTNGAGTSPLNVSYTINLNTTNMYDGNYTATTNVYAAGSSASQGFSSTSSVPFEVLPRIFMAPLPGIGAGSSAGSGLIQTPVGNYSYTIVAGPNGTSAVNLNVTVQVNPPTGVSYQINATTGGLGAGAMPSLYFNYSIDDPAWYDNISYIHMRMYYDEADIPTSVLEGTLRPARYLTTTSSWVQLTCPTCPRTLEVASDPDKNRNVDLWASGVDITGNYVWANVTHYSTFAIAGTVSAAAAGGGGGGGGGTGGGGVTSSEPFDNIAKVETLSGYHEANEPDIMALKASEQHGIYEIYCILKESVVHDIRIEALKGPSKLVKATAPGIVYKNINIWSSSERIKEAIIKFKINNSWLSSNNLASSDVKMVKWYGGKWVELETTEKTKDAALTYYEAKTDTFSHFAITGLKGVEVPTATPAIEVTETPVKPAGTGTPPIPTKAPGFEAIIAILAISLLVASLLRDKKRR